MNERKRCVKKLGEFWAEDVSWISACLIMCQHVDGRTWTYRHAVYNDVGSLIWSKLDSIENEDILQHANILG